MNIGKKKQKQPVREKIKFFQKNWASILSITVSVVAVLISIQSNIYNKRSSNSDILIEDYREVFDTSSNEVDNNSDSQAWYVSVYGCKSENNNEYILHFSTIGEFWISNTGGLNTTLLTTEFTSDIDIYDYRDDSDKYYNTWAASVIYEFPNSDTIGEIGEEINLLEMQAGKGLPVNIIAYTLAFFPTENDALRYAYPLLNGDSFQNPVEKKGTWIFRFSDGKTYSKTYNQAHIYLSAFNANKPDTLSRQLETSCEIMDKKVLP